MIEEVGLDAIRSRIGALDSQSPEGSAARNLGSIAEFEPFGDKYVAALQRRDQAGQTAGSSTSPALFLGSSTFVGSVPTGMPSLTGVSNEKLAAAIAGQAAPLGARAPGGYGSLPVPEDLRALGNGKLPENALTEISQGRHRLFAPAAASWDNLVAAAKADGIEIRITDSYRDYAEQVDLVERKGLYSQGGLAATPGTSNHGWGMAVDADVTDAATRNWLQVNGPRFGWIESVPREPWHWEFRPAQV